MQHYPGNLKDDNVNIGLGNSLEPLPESVLTKTRAMPYYFIGLQRRLWLELQRGFVKPIVWRYFFFKVCPSVSSVTWIVFGLGEKLCFLIKWFNHQNSVYVTPPFLHNTHWILAILPPAHHKKLQKLLMRHTYPY